MRNGHSSRPGRSTSRRVRHWPLCCTGCSTRRLHLAGGPITRTSNGAAGVAEGVVGSLAHDRRHVVAIIGPASQYRSLGIDIESAAESDEELRESVLRSDDPLIDAAAAFVIKEAAYKAWSDFGGGPINHLAVRLRVDGANFTAEMPVPKLDVHGRFVATRGSWIAVATILTSLSPNDHESMTPRS